MALPVAAAARGRSALARLGSGALALALLAPACAPARPPAGEAHAGADARKAASASQSDFIVVDRNDDPSRAARMIAERAARADVVYLGEQHDNPAHHAHQRAVLDALVRLGHRPAVAFEMLEESQQAEVDRALAERPSESELAARLQWRARGWPDFALYWPLFELAAREGLPVIAIDLDRSLARRIARDGLAAAGPRAAAVASLMPPDAAREAAIADTLRTAHCNLLPEARIPAMVAAWHARNVAMARHLAAALDGPRGHHRPVVVIAGRGHQQPGGVPDQLEALRPGTRQLIVSFVEASDDHPRASEGADIVWFTPRVERGDPCALLRAPRRDP